MKLLSLSDIQQVSGASIGTLLVEVFMGQVPWGMSHAVQYIDMPTLAVGTVFGFATGVSSASIFCFTQLPRR